MKLTSPHGDQTPGPWSQLASLQVGLESVQLPDKMADLKYWWNNINMENTVSATIGSHGHKKTVCGCNVPG